MLLLAALLAASLFVFRLLSRRWARALGSAGWLLAGSLRSGDPPLLGGQGLWRSLPLTGPLRRPALAWGARSLAEFGPYLTAPATCPCWGQGLWRSLGITRLRGSTRCDRCDAREQVASAACKRSFVSMRYLRARRGRGRCVPLQALALAGLTSSSDTDHHTATKKAIRDGLSSLLLLSVGTAAPVPPSA